MCAFSFMFFYEKRLDKKAHFLYNTYQYSGRAYHARTLRAVSTAVDTGLEYVR